jgi:uncharacterized glyoxalase superfamily protein PhnB
MKELIPLLRARDLDETIVFYRDLLGFQLCWREGDTASLQSGRVGLMFSTGENLGTEPCLSGTLYFYPENVTGLWEELRGRVEIEWPLETMSYGTREFGIRDCNGYVLAFAEVLGT